MMVSEYEVTPPLDEFLAAYDQDDNEWWRTESGHLLNLFDEAVERMRAAEARAREAEAEVVRVRSPVPDPTRFPIPAPDYTMRTGVGHAPLPDRNTKVTDATKAERLPTDVLVAEIRRRGGKVIHMPPATAKPDGTTVMTDAASVGGGLPGSWALDDDKKEK